MNIVHKLPLLAALCGLLTASCALLDDSVPKKTSPSGLISTPATYYSTAKARYLGTKYKENLERLIERVVRDPKTTTLQFANNISSVGGIGFFTHSATQTPDERYLEIVLVTPETFEMRGAQSEKVERLFSAYGQTLLGILINEPDIFRDAELSGYGLNLAWRNVTAAATGNRVSMERAILYFSKERVRGFLRHEFSQTDLLSDAVIFTVEEDGPLQLVSYKPQEVRPDFRPAIREDNLASTEGSTKTPAVGGEKSAATDANRKLAQKSDPKTTPSTKKEPAPVPTAKLETASSTAETQTQTVADRQPGEAIAQATPIIVGSITKAQPSAPPASEPVAAKQSTGAVIMNAKSDRATKLEPLPDAKPLLPSATVTRTVVETKRNTDTPSAVAPAIVPEASIEAKKAMGLVEAKEPEATASPTSTIKPIAALPLPIVKSAVVPAPIPAKIESLPEAIKPPPETAVTAAKAPIQQAKTSSSGAMKTAEPVKPIVEPQTAPNVVEAKPLQPIAVPTPAVKLKPDTPLSEAEPLAVQTPTPGKGESLPASINRLTEDTRVMPKASVEESLSSRSSVMKVSEPDKPPLPANAKEKAEPPVVALESADVAAASPVRDAAGEKVAGEQIALLKNKPVESTLENRRAVKSAPKALEGFIVQLAFSDREKALRWGERMEQRGYAVSITEAGAEGRLRVRLGNFAQRDDAERQLRNFKQEGLNGIIINLPQGFQPEARSSMP